MICAYVLPTWGIIIKFYVSVEKIDASFIWEVQQGKHKAGLPPKSTIKIVCDFLTREIMPFFQVVDRNIYVINLYLYNEESY
jgi:hypothetical protein